MKPIMNNGNFRNLKMEKANLKKKKLKKKETL